jgi:hypothetical protein
VKHQLVVELSDWTIVGYPRPDIHSLIEHFLPDPNLPARDQLSLSLLDTT